jgi:hypothetical protein
MHGVCSCVISLERKCVCTLMSCALLSCSFQADSSQHMDFAHERPKAQGKEFKAAIRNICNLFSTVWDGYCCNKYSSHASDSASLVSRCPFTTPQGVTVM